MSLQSYWFIARHGATLSNFDSKSRHIFLMYFLFQKIFNEKKHEF